MISIITINFNGASVTSLLLKSLKKVGFSGEVIVVDNGSYTDQAIPLAAQFPWITAIRTPQNLGFAGGNNLGISIAKGDLIMLLNNDTTVAENFESAVTSFFATHPRAGAASPKIRFEYAPRIIQFAGYTSLSPITLRNRLVGFRKTEQGQYPTATTPYAHGAAMVVRREVIDQVGLMPEKYFLYYEEIDWCESIRRSGWQIWYLAEAVVYHKESWSTGKSSPMKSYYLTRNRLIFARDNLSGLNRTLSIIYQITIAAPAKIAHHLFHKQYGNAKAILRGLRDYVTNH